MSVIKQSLTVILGLTALGVSSYVLYLLFRKDDDEDDYTDTYAKISKFKTHQINVPKNVVRSLIGRNGKTIKQIQEQTGTNIYFRDTDSSDYKLCLIKGSVEACNLAENLIQEFVTNQPILENEDIWIPLSSIGRVIGRNGDQISELRTLSGAKITVLDDERGRNSKRISIKGTREQINLAKSLIEDVVEKAMKQQEFLEASLAKREPRVPPKSPEGASRIVESPKVEKMSPIPGQPETPFEIYVSAMVDPSRFWVQIVGPKATELDCLVEEMTEYYGKPENRALHVLGEVKQGDLVAATFLYDKKWYRAEVLKIIESESKQAELYYVDYGDTDTVLCTDLYELRTDFLRLHFQAIECFLARVEPNGESWSEEAVDRFEEWTHVAQWKKLSAKMNGYSVREKTRAKREGSPVPGVDLYGIEEHDIDIAEELVKSGLAVFKKDANLLSSSRTTSNSNISVASSS
ncbi:tudor and KH domain-containing protein homolog [Diorhabda sublineata]|uniref:tudor and KH domain-containing protein homolog n=1 Tax=Diorhabda sublineata TaxID=1163346 RepID=UPI0024E171AD|nr:tudor and KH domain-containing protein homolog [Diorhabda sublineata]